MFTQIKLSPMKSPQGKNLTGNPRHVRDLAADIHANVQQWNNLHLQGVVHLQNIAQKLQDNSYSKDIQELCDKLGGVCDDLDNIVKNFEKIKHQLRAMIFLHKNAGKLFTTWPTTKFADVIETIYTKYHEEANLKRKILENITDNYTDSWKMVHLAAWVHQPLLPENLTTLLESLLIETGHRR